MSNKYCSTCGKPVRHEHVDHHDHFRNHDFHHKRSFHHHQHDSHHHHDDHRHHDEHHHHHDDHHHHHDDHHFEDCICERFFRDDHFRVRLGGLAHGLNFRLRQLIGCIVKLKVNCGGDCKKILAEICYVGNNFIEVKILDKHHDDHHDCDDLRCDDNRHDAVWRKDDNDDKKDRRPRRRRRKRDRRHHDDHHDNKFAIFPLRSIEWFVLHDDCDCDCHCHY